MSRLLDLPAELRNLIYVYVASSVLCDTQFQDPPGVLLASKQIRTEFLDLFYSDRVLRIIFRDIKRQTWLVVGSRRFLQNLPLNGRDIIFRPQNFCFDLGFAMDEVDRLFEEDRGVRFQERLHRGVVEIVESAGKRCATFAVRDSVLVRCGICIL